MGRKLRNDIVNRQRCLSLDIFFSFSSCSCSCSFSCPSQWAFLFSLCQQMGKKLGGCWQQREGEGRGNGGGFNTPSLMDTSQ